MRGQRVRGFFAVVGGCAVAVAGLTIFIAPDKGASNVCALAPSVSPVCTEQLPGGDYVHPSNPATYTQTTAAAGG